MCKSYKDRQDEREVKMIFEKFLSLKKKTDIEKGRRSHYILCTLYDLFIETYYVVIYSQNSLL